jgi:hypothetical protein
VLVDLGHTVGAVVAFLCTAPGAHGSCQKRGLVTGSAHAQLSGFEREGPWFSAGPAEGTDAAIVFSPRHDRVLRCRLRVVALVRRSSDQGSYAAFGEIQQVCPRGSPSRRDPNYFRLFLRTTVMIIPAISVAATTSRGHHRPSRPAANMLPFQLERYRVPASIPVYPTSANPATASDTLRTAPSPPMPRVAAPRSPAPAAPDPSPTASLDATDALVDKAESPSPRGMKAVRVRDRTCSPEHNTRVLKTRRPPLRRAAGAVSEGRSRRSDLVLIEKLRNTVLTQSLPSAHIDPVQPRHPRAEPDRQQAHCRTVGSDTGVPAAMARTAPRLTMLTSGRRGFTHDGPSTMLIGVNQDMVTWPLAPGSAPPWPRLAVKHIDEYQDGGGPDDDEWNFR